MLADQLRAAVKGSGLTLNVVAKRADVPQPVLYRFMARDRSLHLDTADRICKLFSMRLTAPKTLREG
jgi:predicted transcriptional regulator